MSTSNKWMYYVLLKVLLPVCIKYTAQGEYQVTNIAQADCYICPETLTKSCILHKKEIAVLQVFCCILHLKKC